MPPFPGTASTPLVVRSFASQITILHGAVITIQRVRRQRVERGNTAHRSAERPRAVNPAMRILVMGDSYSAGNGAGHCFP
jgi:hypothetical protein